MENSSTTMAFSRLPPRASPMACMRSMSFMKQKVRARATSRSKLRSVRATRNDWLVMSGWSKSAVKSTEKPSAGSRRASLSPSRISTGCSITR